MDDEHLGDGVYVSHDGNGQLALAANHHLNKVVYLDEDVLVKLVAYAKDKGFVL